MVCEYVYPPQMRLVKVNIRRIYDAIRSEKDYRRKTTTVIYGLDADLIMLTLNHLNIAPRLFLYRETPHFIKSVDNSLEPNQTYVIDIPYFASCLKANLLSQTKYDGQNSDDLMHDCIALFLC